MPRFEPFRALRYNLERVELDQVAAPPYDVLSEADLDQLGRRHRANVVHIDVPRERDGDERYALAATTLRRMVDDGLMVQDASPSFTLYRMRFIDEAGRTRETVGVIGGLEVVDVGAGGVLPHERTTPKAKTDRLDLTRATRANLSPVWGLSLAAGLTDLLEVPGEPMGAVVVEGVDHRVERLSDPERVAAIAAHVGSQPVLIADGHHRYAISRTYRDEQRTALGGDAGAAELTMTYVAELVESQLSVDAIHRLYSQTDSGVLLAHLTHFFEPMPAGTVVAGFAREAVERGALCFVDGLGQGTWLTPRPAEFVDVRDLDGARLEHALEGFPHDVTYQHGVQNVVDIVSANGAAAGVIIRPVSITEIQRTAHERLLMPPKSTFFTPKLRTGLVIRPM